MKITCIKTWRVEGIKYNWTLLKVYTDDGLTGIGEGTNWPGSPLLSAISAVDIALWDIAGKRAGMPVYQLLGGAYRKRIDLYGNYWFLDGDGSAESYARQARAMAAAGFGACKFDPFAHVNYRYGEDLSANFSLSAEQKRTALERLAAVQGALGLDFPIAVETHAMLNEC